MPHINSRGLRVTKDGLISSCIDPTPEQKHDAVMGIPPGAVFVTDTEQPVSEIIGWVSMFMHPLFLLQNGLKVRYSHTGIYVGDDKAFEAFPKGVGYYNFARYLNPDRRVTVWHNVKLSVEKLEELREYLDAKAGVKYDWLAILSYALPLREDPAAYTCIEVTVGAFQHVGLLSKGVDTSDLLPMHLANFFASRTGYKMGWREHLEWR